VENWRDLGRQQVNAGPRRWPVLFTSGLGLAILLSLGTWQVFRLQEKTAQIAAIDARIAAAPTPLAEALARAANGENLEYTKVQMQGAFLAVPDLRKLGTFNGGPGYELIAPLLTDDATLVLVDRGAIPAEQRDPKYRMAPRETATHTGILRLHNKGQGLFDPDNSPETNQWYWWDIPAMLAAVDVPANAKVSNLIVQLLPEQTEQAPPFPAALKSELRNNHLGYAITWYGLAAALVAVTWAFVRKRA
jgi:surfeit locus 1 family protein